MAYNRNIPRNVDIISDSQDALQQNYARVFSYSNSDHIGFPVLPAPPSVDEGHHRQMNFELIPGKGALSMRNNWYAMGYSTWILRDFTIHELYLQRFGKVLGTPWSFKVFSKNFFGNVDGDISKFMIGSDIMLMSFLAYVPAANQSTVNYPPIGGNEINFTNVFSVTVQIINNNMVANDVNVGVYISGIGVNSFDVRKYTRVPGTNPGNGLMRVMVIGQIA